LHNPDAKSDDSTELSEAKKRRAGTGELARCERQSIAEDIANWTIDGKLGQELLLGFIQMLFASGTVVGFALGIAIRNVDCCEYVSDTGFINTTNSTDCMRKYCDVYSENLQSYDLKPHIVQWLLIFLIYDILFLCLGVGLNIRGFKMQVGHGRLLQYGVILDEDTKSFKAKAQFCFKRRTKESCYLLAGFAMSVAALYLYFDAIKEFQSVEVSSVKIKFSPVTTGWWSLVFSFIEISVIGFLFVFKGTWESLSSLYMRLTGADEMLQSMILTTNVPWYHVKHKDLVDALEYISNVDSKAKKYTDKMLGSRKNKQGGELKGWKYYWFLLDNFSAKEPRDDWFIETQVMDLLVGTLIERNRPANANVAQV